MLFVYMSVQFPWHEFTKKAEKVFQALLTTSRTLDYIFEQSSGDDVDKHIYDQDTNAIEIQGEFHN